MLMPAVDSVPRGVSVVEGDSTPAPTGGWNVRDNIASMKPDEALIMDNWFPETSRVTLRNGHEIHATDMGIDSVETLMAYSSGTTSKLFAVTNHNEIYNVSASGDVSGSELFSVLEGRVQYVNFGTVGGQFIVCVNGLDAPFNYDGTNWNTPAITGSGLTSSNLIHVNAFKSRLFFVEKNTMNAWYLPVNTISGAATKFDISSLCTLGGYLMAMGTWTRDGGNGVDDLAVFVTSKGEVIIYQGADPGSSTNWALVGVFRIGSPIGRRCMYKFGGELVIISQDGFLPLSRVLGSGRSSKQGIISDKIVKAVSMAARNYGSNFGWQAILYPRGNMGIFNIPVKELGTTHQYVVNTTTGAWCRFTGQNAVCWEVFNDELYFGATASAPDYCGVYKADTGQSDNGANIEGDLKPAFNYFGTRRRLKRFSQMRPVFTTNGEIQAAIALNVDFEDKLPSNTPTFSGTGGSAWDVSPWDTSPWDVDEQISKDWQGIEGIGYCATVRMKVATNSLTLSLNSMDWLYEPGGFI